MVTTKLFTSRRHVFAVISPRLAEITRLEPFTWQKAIPPSQVPPVGGLPCLACKRFDAFSKETYEKLALPG